MWIQVQEHGQQNLTWVNLANACEVNDIGGWVTIKFSENHRVTTQDEQSKGRIQMALQRLAR
jgi:hypothetical protein